jgi:hypothetical protein
MYVTNIWAVLIATFVVFFIGWLWYSPKLFGKKWAQLSGVSEESMQNPKGMGKKMLANFIGVFVMAWVLSHFAEGLGVIDVWSSLEFGFWMWLAFFATATGPYLWEGKPWKLWILNSSYALVILEVLSLIVVLWR